MLRAIVNSIYLSSQTIKYKDQQDQPSTSGKVTRKRKSVDYNESMKLYDFDTEDDGQDFSAGSSDEFVPGEQSSSNTRGKSL